MNTSNGEILMTLTIFTQVTNKRNILDNDSNTEFYFSHYHIKENVLDNNFNMYPKKQQLKVLMYAGFKKKTFSNLSKQQDAYSTPFHQRKNLKTLYFNLILYECH